MKWVRELTLAPGGRSSMGCPSYSFPRPPGYAIGADLWCRGTQQGEKKLQESTKPILESWEMVFRPSRNLSLQTQLTRVLVIAELRWLKDSKGRKKRGG